MKHIKTFKQISEAKRPLYNLKKNNYGFYILHTETKKIAEGFQYKEDAQDRIKELLDESDNFLKGKLKVYTKIGLKKFNIDPNDDSNWADPKWKADKEEDSK